jgi:hypothetical protein
MPVFVLHSAGLYGELLPVLGCVHRLGRLLHGNMYIPGCNVAALISGARGAMDAFLASMASRKFMPIYNMISIMSRTRLVFAPGAASR